MCSNGVSIVLWGPQFNMGWFMVFNATFKYFIYIVAVSFIGGGNRCTLRNRRPTKSHLTGFIMYEHISPERGSNSQLDYHTFTTTTAPSLICGNETNIKIQSINGMNHFDAQMIQDCTYKDTRVCGVQNYTVYIRINFKIELSVTSNGIVIGKACIWTEISTIHWRSLVSIHPFLAYGWGYKETYLFIEQRSMPCRF